jgi:tetratricopeptide (TPR) repeat protein
MKNILFLALSLGIVSAAQSQIIAPKASPACKIEQRVGLADISISYSRPAVNGRIIFGDLIPFDAYWRLGANENTKFTTSDALFFGNDTLPAGTYALFAMPGKTSWKLAFYTEFGNWGMPPVWDPKKVALELTSTVSVRADRTENLTIGLDQLENSGADLFIAWDRVAVKFPFTLNTKDKVLASIQKVMNGPSANDYHTAAKFYLDEKINNKQALEWVEKAIASRPEAYWMFRTKSLIQAELGLYAEAIKTAEQCIKLAEADGDSTYVNQSKNSITAWKKLK